MPIGVLTKRVYLCDSDVLFMDDNQTVLDGVYCEQTSVYCSQNPVTGYKKINSAV